MSSDFYRSFEEKFRGSRELVKSRLQVYLPFVAWLRKVYEDIQAVDVGCGRGEWLELLRESGVDAHGVDLNEGMLDTCRNLGLSVEKCEAVSYVESLSDESKALITGFHIAEHIPFEDLQNLVQQALRVLQPAGLLILETPNPENILVGTYKFYLDPTHQHPLPPQLLAYLPEYYGFHRTKIMYLRESPNPAASKKMKLFSLFYHVSLDYAVVAQKGAPQEQLKAFNRAF